MNDPQTSPTPLPRARSRRITAAAVATTLLASLLTMAPPQIPPASAAASTMTTPIELADFSAGTVAPWSDHVEAGNSGFDFSVTPAHAGSFVGRLDLTVPTGATAASKVDLYRDTADMEVQSLTFRLRSTSVTDIWLGLHDEGGRTHQQRITLSPGVQGWQSFTITELAGGQGYDSWGSGSPGVWSGGLDSFSLSLTAAQIAGDDTRASVDIDAVVVSAGATSTEIGGFEQAEGWNVAEHNGAAAAITPVSGYSSRPAATAAWTRAAPGGTGNVELHRDVDSVATSALQLTLRTDDLDGVDVWLRDGSGETHKQWIDLQADSTTWQTVTIDDFDGGASSGSWGGDGDGAWSGELDRISIVVTPAVLLPGSLRPHLEIGSLAATDERARPAEDLIVGDFSDQAEGWTVYGNGPMGGSWAPTQQSPASGPDAARLTVTKSGSGGVAHLRRNTPGGLIPRGVSLKVRSQQITQIQVTLKDSDEQTFFHDFTVSSGTTWQPTLSIDLDDMGHWGMPGHANDGVFRGDVTEVLISVKDSWLRGGASSAVVDIDAVTVHVEQKDIAIRPTTLGNVFTVGQDVTVGFSSAVDELGWTVLDNDGIVVDSGRSTASDLDGRIALDVGQDLSETGWYDVRLEGYRFGTRVATARTGVAIVSPFDVEASTDTRLGASTHYGNTWSTATIPLLPLGGYQFARDEAHWREQEKSAGTIAWTDKVEAYTSQLAAHDLDLFLVLSYGNALYGGIPDDTASRKAFAAYAVAAITKFGTDSTRYEVWNEWNIAAGMEELGKLEQDALKTAPQYAALLAEVDDAVDGAGLGHAEIVGPGSAGLDAPWMNAFAAAGGFADVDTLSFHPYLQPQDASGLQQVFDDAEAIMSASAVDLPIVLSELGWPTGSSGAAVTEARQADYLAQSIALALARGAERYTVYDLVDDGVDDDEVEHRFGILRHLTDAQGSYTPKPAYVAVGTMARALDELPGAGVSTPLPGTFVASFGSTPATQVVWSQEPRTVVISASAPITVTTTMGEERVLTPLNNRIVLGIGPSPLILSGAHTEVMSNEPIRFSFSIDPSVAGEAPQGRVEIDRTETTSASASVEIDGVTSTMSASAGAVGGVDVSLTVPEADADRRYTAMITSGGKTMGMLFAESRVVEPATLEATHAVADDGTELLRIRATNNLGVPLIVDDLSWSVGSAVGSDAISSIPAGETYTVDVPLGSPVSSADGSVTLSTRSQGTFTQPALIRPHTVAATVPRGTIVVDGEVDAATRNQTALDLSAVGVQSGGNWTGPADLSGSLWWAADEDYLYLTAEITDDAHLQSSTGSTLWKMDAIEFAIAAGAPGETTGRSEIGISLPPNMSVLHRSRSASGDTAMPGAQFKAERVSATSPTVYEVAIPWELLRPAYAEDRLISLSAVVYDVDSANDERGWYRWGDGIVGGKDPAEYLPVLIAPSP